MNLTVLGALIGGSFGAALVGLIQFLLSRHDKKKAAESAERKALRYLMLYIIQERAKELIVAKEVTLEDRRSLTHWHDVYHVGLGGNGDADALMNEVMHLPIKAD